MNFQVHCPVCSGEFDVEDRLDQDNPRTSQHQCPWCGALISTEDAYEHLPELPVSGFLVPDPNDADLLELEEPTPDDNFTGAEPETFSSDPQSDSSFDDNEVDLGPVAKDLGPDDDVSDGEVPDGNVLAGDLSEGASPESDNSSAEETAEPPAMAWNQLAARPRPQPKQQSALRKMLPPVLGGLTAIPIAIGILWYGFGRDLGNAGPTVSRYAPWIVPKHLRGRNAGYAGRWNQNSSSKVPANQEKKPNLDAGAFGKIGGGLSDLQSTKKKSADTGWGVFGGMGGGSSSTDVAPKPTTQTVPATQTVPDNPTSPDALKARSDPPSSIEENIAMDIVEETAPPEEPEAPAEMFDRDATIPDEPSMEPMPSQTNESLLPSTAADNAQEMRIKPDDDLIPADFGEPSAEGIPSESMPVAGSIEGAEETSLSHPQAALIEAETEKILGDLSTALNLMTEKPPTDSPSLPTELALDRVALQGEVFSHQLAQLALGLDAATGTPYEEELRDRVSNLATRILQSKSMRTAIEESSLNLIARATPPEIGEISVWICDTMTAIGEEQNEDDGGNLLIESSPSLMLQARVARLVIDRNRTPVVEKFPGARRSNPNPLEESPTIQASKLVFGKLLQWDDAACVVEIIAVFP